MQFIGAYILTISTFLLVCQEAFYAHFFVRKMLLDFSNPLWYTGIRENFTFFLSIF